MDQPEMISIIVPVYNVEGYLADCVASLLNQTYRNLEIILINDGSSDDSGKICDSLAYKNPLIKVLHQSNAGAGAARNRGLSMAEGSYIAFVDADDWVSPFYLETLLKYNYLSRADLSVCGYTRDSLELETAKINLRPSLKVISADYIFNHLLNHESFDGYLWNKLFRKDTIIEHHIHFKPDFIVWEDMFFYAQYLKYIQNVAIGADKVYFYRENGSSITSKCSMEKYKCMVTASKAFITLETDPACLFYQASRKLLVEQLITYIHKCCKNRQFDAQGLSSDMQLLRKTAKECRLSTKEKMKILYLWLMTKAQRKNSIDASFVQ